MKKKDTENIQDELDVRIEILINERINQMLIEFQESIQLNCDSVNFIEGGTLRDVVGELINTNKRQVG